MYSLISSETLSDSNNIISKLGSSLNTENVEFVYMKPLNCNSDIKCSNEVNQVNGSVVINNYQNNEIISSGRLKSCDSEDNDELIDKSTDSVVVKLNEEYSCDPNDRSATAEYIRKKYSFYNSAISKLQLPYVSVAESTNGDCDLLNELCTDSQLHECVHCNENFTTKTSLQQHAHIHNDQVGNVMNIQTPVVMACREQNTSYDILEQWSNLKEFVTLDQKLRWKTTVELRRLILSNLNGIDLTKSSSTKNINDKSRPQPTVNVLSTKVSMKKIPATAQTFQDNVKKQLSHVTYVAGTSDPVNGTESHNYISEKKFVCAVSSTTSVLKNTLKFVRHKRLNASEKNFKCSLCMKAFALQSCLIRHEKVHYGANRHQRTIYNKISLLSRKRTHTSDSHFVCDICNITFRSRWHLVVHKRTHSGEEPFLCKIDDKTFEGKSKLNCHERTHTGEKLYSCTSCNKAFARRWNLEHHTRTHTGEKPYSCTSCNKAFAQRSFLEMHLRTHTGEKPYSCTFCNKAFAQRSILKKHTRTHTGEKPYSCTFCNKAFAQRSILKKHTRTHTGEKPYSCTSCNEAFALRSYLEKHLRTHTGEKPYSCTSCNEAFALRSYLEKHLRTHTGEKPYSCTSCNKAFAIRSQLVLHTRTHTGEKPYSCTSCNEAFALRSYLEKHLRTHTGEKPYSCTSCNKAFAIRSQLVLHTRTHTGEKPYSCTSCNKAFAQRSILKKHTRTHTGEKPYLCISCNKAFAHRSNLVLHTRTHTAEKNLTRVLLAIKRSHKDGTLNSIQELTLEKTLLV